MIRTERLLHSHYDLQSVQEKVSMWLHCRFERGGCTVQLHIPNWKVDHGQLAHSVKSSQTANFVLKESSVQKRNDTLERSFVFSLRGWDDDDLKTTTTTTKRKRKRKKQTTTKRKRKKEIPLYLQRTYLWWTLCTLYLLACQVRVTVSDSGLYCSVCVTFFEQLINSLVCWIFISWTE